MYYASVQFLARKIMKRAWKVYGIRILTRVFQNVETVCAIAFCCRNAIDDLGVLAWKFLGIQNIVQNLAPSDFQLFPKLNKFLSGRRFKNDERSEE